jgi:DNA-binding transcriptional regulator YiaG
MEELAKCKVCGKTFSTYAGLGGHMNVHSNVEGLRRAKISEGLKRAYREGRRKAKLVNITVSPEELKKLYWNEHLTLKQIATMYGVAPTSLRRLMDKLNIKKRGKSEAAKLRKFLHNKGWFKKGLKPWNFKRPSKDELLKLYNDEKLSTSEIAEIYGVHGYTVKRWLNHYEIPTDPKRRRRTWKDNVRKSVSELWKNPEYLKHMREVHKNPENVRKSIENLKYRPTSLERKLLQIIKKHNLPYSYVGDGSFRIGRLNPDFINNNGQKVAVDVFGDYWHNREETPWYGRESIRKLIMKRYGWDLRVIWEHELFNLPEEEIVRRLM